MEILIVGQTAGSPGLCGSNKNMSKVLLREYYELCEGGVCQDLLTEEEKIYVGNGGMMLSGKLQEADVQN